MKKIAIVYNATGWDGIMAAAAVKTQLGNDDNEFTLVPFTYGEDVSMLYDYFRKQNFDKAYLLDLSFAEHHMNILDSDRILVWFDHSDSVRYYNEHPRFCAVEGLRESGTWTTGLVSQYFEKTFYDEQLALSAEMFHLYAGGVVRSAPNIVADCYWLFDHRKTVSEMEMFIKHKVPVPDYKLGEVLDAIVDEYKALEKLYEDDKTVFIIDSRGANPAVLAQGFHFADVVVSVSPAPNAEGFSLYNVMTRRNVAKTVSAVGIAVSNGGNGSAHSAQFIAPDGIIEPSSIRTNRCTAGTEALKQLIDLAYAESEEYCTSLGVTLSDDAPTSSIELVDFSITVQLVGFRIDDAGDVVFCYACDDRSICVERTTSMMSAAEITTAVNLITNYYKE